MDGSTARDGNARPHAQGTPLTEAPVLVHVGLARTGTTWLQKHVFANSPHLFTPADPSLPPMERAKQLGRRLCKDGQERLVNELDFDIAAFRQDCEAIRVPAGQRAVISSERLSGSVLSGGFDRAIISRRIKAVFPNARILLVIREQRALLMSMYIQYLKYGGWHPIGDFVDPPSDGRLPCFAPSYLMYDRLISLYQETFGTANVLVLPYEKFATATPDYVGEICAFAGIPELPAFPLNRVENARRRNVSSYALKRIAYRFRSSSANGFAPSVLPKRVRAATLQGMRALIDLVVPQTLEKRFSERLRSDLDRALPPGFYAESNRRAAELTALPLARYGYE
jgi:Sulfotransferase family